MRQKTNRPSPLWRRLFACGYCRETKRLPWRRSRARAPGRTRTPRARNRHSSRRYNKRYSDQQCIRWLGRQRCCASWPKWHTRRERRPEQSRYRGSDGLRRRLPAAWLMFEARATSSKQSSPLSDLTAADDGGFLADGPRPGPLGGRQSKSVAKTIPAKHDRPIKSRIVSVLEARAYFPTLNKSTARSVHGTNAAPAADVGPPPPISDDDGFNIELVG